MTRIVEINSCKECPYFRGSVYTAYPDEKAQLPETNELLHGNCYHPTQYDPQIPTARQGRAILPDWTIFKDGFPTWCELEIKVTGGVNDGNRKAG